MNAMFTGYAALNVRKLSLLNGDEIDLRNFDTLRECLRGDTEQDPLDGVETSPFEARSRMSASVPVGGMLESGPPVSSPERIGVLPFFKPVLWVIDRDSGIRPLARGGIAFPGLHSARAVIEDLLQKLRVRAAGDRRRWLQCTQYGRWRNNTCCTMMKHQDES